MAEYIDRKALLNSICKKYCDCDYDGECPNCRLTEPIVAAPAASVPQWISVKDRMPENGEYVLCWYEYFRYGDFNAMFAAYGIGYCYNGHWGGEVANGTKARVLAWMPLPEPPKGEAE